MATPSPDHIAALRARFAEFGRRYPIERIDVFGSVANGTATPRSDLDLLVTLKRDEAVSMDDLLEMAGEAEEVAGCPVDFVLKDQLVAKAHPQSSRHIIESAVCIYGS